MRAGARLRLAAALGVAALAACGDTDAPESHGVDTVAVAVEAAADSSLVTACDLITEAELEGILGVELEPARLTNDVPGVVSQCRWNLPGDAQRGVSLSLHEHGDLGNYERVPGAEAASGLGDAAIWNAAYGQLAVLDGERVLSVGLLVGSPQRSHAERIARVALEKL